MPRMKQVLLPLSRNGPFPVLACILPPWLLSVSSCVACSLLSYTITASVQIRRSNGLWTANLLVLIFSSLPWASSSKCIGISWMTVRQLLHARRQALTTSQMHVDQSLIASCSKAPLIPATAFYYLRTRTHLRVSSIPFDMAIFSTPTSLSSPFSANLLSSALQI